MDKLLAIAGRFDLMAEMASAILAVLFLLTAKYDAATACFVSAIYWGRGASIRVLVDELNKEPKIIDGEHDGRL